jgi:hypothetical protein
MYHFQSDDATEFLDFKFTLEDFCKIPEPDWYEIDLRFESHPLSDCECLSGYLVQHFWCLNPIDSILFTVKH